MNFKKFIVTFTLTIMSFLFIMGGISLYYINSKPLNFFNNKTDESDKFITPQDSNGSINILVLGGDKVNNNSDTMMLVNFDPKTTKTSILSIPRDTKVKIKSYYSKINAAYPMGGSKLAVSTVSKMLNVKIQYYIFVDTSSFEKVINLLGGIDFYVPANLDYDDPTQNLHIHLKKGMQHLNGNQAEQYMRFRKYSNGKVTELYDGSDLKRIDAQQAFIKELIRQKFNIFYITKFRDVMNVVFNNLETNIKLNEALRLIKNINAFDANKINMFKLPGYSVREETWYYICNKKQTFEIVEKYFNSNGESNDEVSMIGTVESANNTGTKTVKSNPSNSNTNIKGSKIPGP